MFNTSTATEDRSKGPEVVTTISTPFLSLFYYRLWSE